MIKKIICLMLLFCISCTNSNNNKNIDKETNLFEEPESLYRLAKISFDEKNFYSRTQRNGGLRADSCIE